MHLIKEKQKDLSEWFSKLDNSQKIYLKIMEMGRSLPKLDTKYHIEAYRVQGCQSEMYLRPSYKNGQLFFEAHSDALISAGIAAILIHLLSGSTPDEILTFQPDVLQALNITSSLSPSRSNGLTQILLSMKKHALSYLARSLNS